MTTVDVVHIVTCIARRVRRWWRIHLIIVRILGILIFWRRFWLNKTLSWQAGVWCRNKFWIRNLRRIANCCWIGIFLASTIFDFWIRLKLSICEGVYHRSHVHQTRIVWFVELVPASGSLLDLGRLGPCFLFSVSFSDNLKILILKNLQFLSSSMTLNFYRPCPFPLNLHHRSRKVCLSYSFLFDGLRRICASCWSWWRWSLRRSHFWFIIWIIFVILTEKFIAGQFA